MAEYCIKTDLPTVTCSHCRGLDESWIEPREVESKPFTARYDGQCAGCGFDIRSGEEVRYANGGRLYHVGHEE